jgi:hypothetical protein
VALLNFKIRVMMAQGDAGGRVTLAENGSSPGSLGFGEAFAVFGGPDVIARSEPGQAPCFISP